MALAPTPYSEQTDKQGYNGFIDAITLPTGSKYEIVDSGARTLLNNMSSYTSFLGVTTSTIVDGTTSAVININGSNVTATVGDIVIKKTNSTSAGRIAQEFIYTGSTNGWQLFGDISADNLGDLAYKDAAVASYTPAGSITITTKTLTSTGKYTPAGSVTYTVTNKTAKLSTTSTAPTGSATANFWIYRPSGSIAVSPTRTLNTASVLSSISGNSVISSVTAHAPNATVPNLGVNYTQVDDHNLKLWYIIQNSTNAISSTSTKTVVTGVTVQATGTFTGTEIYVKHPTVSVPDVMSFTGTQASIVVTATSIDTIKFVGTPASITAT